MNTKSILNNKIKIDETYVLNLILDFLGNQYETVAAPRFKAKRLDD